MGKLKFFFGNWLGLSAVFIVSFLAIPFVPLVFLYLGLWERFTEGWLWGHEKW